MRVASRVILAVLVAWLLVGARRAGAEGYPTPGTQEYREALLSAIGDLAPVYGVDPNWAVRVVWCESTAGLYNVDRYGTAFGPWQYQLRTWYELSARYGWAGADPFDPVASTAVTFAAWSDGEYWRWSCR